MVAKLLTWNPYFSTLKWPPWKQICRDLASSIQQEELDYLQRISEILLFLLLKEQDFNAVPFRAIAREILVNDILKPTLDLVSDPDFINQTLVWLYQDYKIKNDIFLTSIRTSENMEELLAAREMVAKEVSFIRSNDSKGKIFVYKIEYRWPACLCKVYNFKPIRIQRVQFCLLWTNQK